MGKTVKLNFISPLIFKENEKEKDPPLISKESIISETYNTVKTEPTEPNFKRQQTRVKERKAHLFKTGTALNNYLIRDFVIGDTNDPSKSSKKKLDMTTNMFNYISQKKYNKK